MLRGIHAKTLVTVFGLFLSLPRTHRAENDFSSVSLPDWRPNSEYVSQCLLDNLYCDWTKIQQRKADVTVNILESSPLGLKGDACLEFWFLVPAAASGSKLRVLLKSSAGLEEIWISTAFATDSWRQVFVPLTFTPETQIVLEASSSEEQITFQRIGVRRGFCGSQCDSNTEFWTDEWTRCICSEDQLSCSPSQCREGQICGRRSRRSTEISTTGTCTIHSHTDCSTFDGVLFRFMSPCTYLLAKTCPRHQSLPGFSVEVVNGHNRNSSQPAIEQVTVDTGNFRVSLLKRETQRVVVNGVWMKLPLTLSSGSLSIKSSPASVVLETRFGLSVSFDNAGAVHVALPRSYSDEVCGLCGNFNHLKEDDLRKPDGTTAPSATALVESWRTGQSTSSCETIQVPHQCDPQEEAEYASERHCGGLLSNTGPFAACRSVVESESYFRGCVVSMCSNHGDPSVLCKVLQAYSDVCEEAGVGLPTWRNSSFCALQCAENSHYNSCAHGCPAVCSSLDLQSSCGTCEERCECDDGFKLSGGKCVPAEDCGCWHKGKHYENGETFVAGECAQQCECLGNGQMWCNDMQCADREVCKVRDGVKGCFPFTPTTCSVYGDPHYITYDGMAYDFQGGCSYVLTTTCGGGPVQFTVIGHNVHPPLQNFTRSKVEAATLQMGDFDLTLNQSGDVYVRDSRVPLPYSANETHGSVWVYRKSDYVILETSFGLRMMVGARNRLFLQVDESYKYELCGLCGTFSGYQDDDLVTSAGQNTTDPFEFGDSWRTAGNDECTAVPNKPRRCTIAEENQAYAECNALLDGAFRLCHGTVHPGIYLNSCVYDYCATNGDRHTLCESLTSYAAACQVAGVELPPWQEDTACAAPPTTAPATTPARATPDQTMCPINCNFERNLCGWEQLVQDSFDWTRHSGPTPSALTGPNGDHTTGAGFYMYIEGNRVTHGDSARLLSSMCHYDGPMCVNFWYHMYGSASAMALNIYLLKDNRATKVWSRANNQGPKWHLGNIEISVSGPFQIIVEAIRGSNAESDVAIDDISIDFGLCGERDPDADVGTVVPATTAQVLPAVCDLDCSYDNDLCRWEQMVSDSFDWTWQSGSTPTQLTGPSADHTGGGHYLYIEASRVTHGDTARLISSECSATGPKCLQFWYHMYGSADTMGITVYLLQGRVADSVWLKRNNQGNTWHLAQVDFTTQGAFQIIFEGRRGSNDQSDVAIDDVSLRSGSCADLIKPTTTTAAPQHPTTTAAPQPPTTTAATQPPTTTAAPPTTTAAPEPPTTTVRPQPPTTSVAPQPPTTAEPRPPTTDEPQRPTTDEPEPPTTTARPQPPTTTVAPQPPTTTVAPQPPTTTEPRPPTTDEPQSPTTDEPEPPTTNEPQPPTTTVRPQPPTTTARPQPLTTTVAPQPPTTAEPRPPTTDEPQPPTTTARPQPPTTTVAPQPPTTDEPEPPTTDEPQPPTTTVATQPPTTAEPRPPTTDEPEPPTTEEPQPPTTDEPEPPTTNEPQPPTTTVAPQPPTTAEPRPPTTDEPEPPTTDEPQPPTTDEPQPPTTDEPQPPTTDEPQPPTTTVTTQPPTTAEPRPPTTDEPEPPTTEEPQPPTTNEPQPQTTTVAPQPPTTAEPRPPTTDEPEPPTTDEPQPPTTDEPQPPTTTVATQPPTTAEPRPPTTDEPQPPTTEEPQPPTTDEPEPPTTNEPQPPTTTVRPQPPTTAEPQPPTTDEPEPPTTNEPQPPTATVRPQPPTTTARPQPPTTTVAPQPPTTDEPEPPTTDEPQPPTTDEPEPPTTNEPQPPTTTVRPQPPTTTARPQLPTTTVAPQPPTTDEPEPPTTDEPQPPTTDEPEPPTTDEPQPPTTDEPQPPTTTVRPQPPTTAEPQPPTTDEPEPPTTDEPEPPTTDKPAPPTTAEPQPPTTDEPEPPTTDEPEPPTTTVRPQPPTTTARPQPPTTAVPRPPTTDEPEPPTTDEPHPPTTDEPQPPTTNEPQPPTTTARPQPPTTAEPRPPTTDEPEPPTTDEAQPPTTDEPHPPTTDEPEPQTTNEPQPPTTTVRPQPPTTTARPQPPTTTVAPQPPTTAEPRPPTTDEPEPPTTDEPQPPTTAEPRPPTTDEPEPPTTDEPQPPTTDEPQPPTTDEPQPPTTTVRPQPPTTAEPQPPTTDKPEPPTTDEPEPPTTDEPAPPTTAEPQPPTTDEPEPPTTDEPEPPTTTVRPQPPTTTARPQPPTTAVPRPPTTDEPEPPTTDEPHPPTTDEPQPPTTNEPQPPTTTARPQPPTTAEPRPPTTDEPEPPTTDEAQPPTTDEPEPPTTDEPHPPTTDEPEPQTTNEPQPPTTTVRPQPPTTTARPQPPTTTVASQPPTTAEPRPPTTDEPEPPTTDEPEPPTTDEPQPPTTAEPRPPTTDEPEPPTTDEPQPPTTIEPQPPTTDEPQPPTTTVRPQPPTTTARPQPPTTAEPRPPTTDEPQPPTTPVTPQTQTTTVRPHPSTTTSKPQPPTTTSRPQHPTTTGRPQPPTTTVRPQPPTTTGRPQPPTITGRPQPPTTTVRPQPPTTTGSPHPPTTTVRPQPPTTTGRPQPPTTTGRPQPPTTTVRPQPPTTTGRPQPPTTTGRPQPPTTTGRPQSPTTTVRPQPPTTAEPTPSCPRNSHYTACVLSCRPTCWNLNGPPSCNNNTSCEPGCVCNDGFVWKRWHCVPITECGCVDGDGNKYQFNDRWYTDHCREECKCEKDDSEGKIECEEGCDGDEVCLRDDKGEFYCKSTDFSECSIKPDPEYRTFDKLTHDFKGEHSYVLVRTRNLPSSLPSVHVVAVNRGGDDSDEDDHDDDSSEEDRSRGDEDEDDNGEDGDHDEKRRGDDSEEDEGRYSLRELKVVVYNHTVELKRNRKLFVDGQRTRMPASPSTGLTIRERSSHMYLTTDFGLTVQFDGRSTAEIILPHIYKRRVGGLCGYFDGHRQNDLMKPDGSRARTVQEFGRSWRV